MKKKVNLKNILIILTIIISLYLVFGLNNNHTSPSDTIRCSYCGKVIRSDGRNIHATPIYNGKTLKCKYCGHKTNIN